jgi:hypothetical protein
LNDSNLSRNVTEKLSFLAISHSADIVGAAAAMGIVVQGTASNRASARCPHHDDEKESLSFFVGRDGRGRFKCHAVGCGQHGDAIDLVAMVKSVTKIEAARWLVDNRFASNGKPVVSRAKPQTFVRFICDALRLPLRSSVRLTLIFLATHAEQSGKQSFPASASWVAKKVGISERVARCALRSLEERHAIKIVRKKLMHGLNDCNRVTLTSDVWSSYLETPPPPQHPGESPDVGKNVPTPRVRKVTTPPRDVLAVLAMAERGFRLLPVQPNSKHPLLHGWPDSATSNRETIETFLRRFPCCNWGCLTGHGLLVVDIDGSEGQAGWGSLLRNYGDAIETLSVKTSRGIHLYFNLPEGVTIGNGILLPSIDLKSDRGYVLVPPSVHPDGTQYKWVDARADIMAAPSWLIDLLIEEEREGQVPASVVKHSAA